MAGFFMHARMTDMPQFRINDVLFATTLVAAWFATLSAGPTIAGGSTFALYFGLIVYRLLTVKPSPPAATN
jgi:hypothetical protein